MIDQGVEIGPYYILDQKIGSGAFASVWRGHHKLINSSVAIKVISSSNLKTEKSKTRLQREIAIMKQMKHPFIVPIYDIYANDIESDLIFLVMEYVHNGNLLEFVNANGCLSENDARKYLAQMVSILEYLHNKKNICHRDLKCENILIDKNKNLKLVDFGLSNTCFSSPPFTNGNSDSESKLSKNEEYNIFPSWIDDNNIFNIESNMSTSCGSPAYASPEMIKGSQYSKNVDIWSLGIIFYSILVGHLPFQDNNLHRLLQKIVYSEPTYPRFLTPTAVDLLKKMLTKDPKNRITLQDIKGHPFFSMTEYENACNFVDNYDEIIDQSDIVEQLSRFGVDTNSLRTNLANNEINSLTSMYNILKNEKILEMLRDIEKMTAALNKVARMQSALAVRKVSKYIICTRTNSQAHADNINVVLQVPQIATKLNQQIDQQPQTIKKNKKLPSVVQSVMMPGEGNPNKISNDKQQNALQMQQQTHCAILKTMKNTPKVQISARRIHCPLSLRRCHKFATPNVS